MALVVFLRGANVGGHRNFRPSIVARELRRFDVVNIGAAGTFVVRKSGTRATFRAALASKLPFEAGIAMCDGRDIIKLLDDANPFADEPSLPEVVRFVSIVLKPSSTRPPFPIALPANGLWLLRILAAKGPFVFGVYRRNMKTIGYLGQIDKLVGAPVTTRNWNTIAAIARILKDRR